MIIVIFFFYTRTDVKGVRHGDLCNDHVRRVMAPACNYRINFHQQSGGTCKYLFTRNFYWCLAKTTIIKNFISFIIVSKTNVREVGTITLSLGRQILTDILKIIC